VSSPVAGGAADGVAGNRIGSGYDGRTEAAVEQHERSSAAPQSVTRHAASRLHTVYNRILEMIPPEKVTIFTDAQAAIGRVAAGRTRVCTRGKKVDSALEGGKARSKHRSAVVPGSRRSDRQRESRRGQQGRQQKNRDTCGVEWMGQADQYGRRKDAITQVTSRHQAGDLGKEVGRSMELSQGEEVQNAEDHTPGWTGGHEGPEGVTGAVPPARDGTLPRWPILEIDEEREHGRVRVAWIQGPRRENTLFKNCVRWKPQQKTLWAEVQKEAGRGKNRLKIRDLFAHERCTRPILDFLRSAGVGSRVGPKEVRAEPGGDRGENGDAGRGEGEDTGDEEGAEEK